MSLNTCIQQCCHCFCINFCMPKSLRIFQTQSHFMSSWLTNRQPTIDFNLCTVCWRSLAPGVVFHPLYETLVPFKNTSVWYGVSSIHLQKPFKCLWSFPPPNFRFAEQPGGRGKKTKVSENKCNRYRKQRLVIYSEISG